MTPKQYKYHAETLAEAIRQFRNVPELRKLVKIRATPQFVGLVRAWEGYTDQLREEHAQKASVM